MEAPERLNNISDYIIQNHSRKTHNKQFTAIFCVSRVEVLIEYYKLLLEKKRKGEHQLRMATIFSYNTNEDDKDALGYMNEDDVEFMMAAEPSELYASSHSRDILEEFIQEYNQEFGTNYTNKDSQSFYNYYNDIARRVKNKQVDLLVVVNMFLTGFDSKYLNTLYVDKNLKYHGLIQAYSRTNRILDELKSQGNIVCFRNLKNATDEAIKLFSNANANEEIIIEPYEKYLDKFNAAFIHLLKIAPTVNSVSQLKSEEDELAFIKAFREIMRLKNVLATFTEFTFDDVSMPEQTFDDYKSK
jgi:type I restriction enzyme R subunit